MTTIVKPFIKLLTTITKLLCSPDIINQRLMKPVGYMYVTMYIVAYNYIETA